MKDVSSLITSAMGSSRTHCVLPERKKIIQPKSFCSGLSFSSSPSALLKLSYWDLPVTKVIVSVNEDSRTGEGDEAMCTWKVPSSLYVQKLLSAAQIGGIGCKICWLFAYCC